MRIIWLPGQHDAHLRVFGMVMGMAFRAVAMIVSDRI